jgi:hypothetical protein
VKVTRRIALSIRQPYAELILRRLKRFEYRTRPTNLRGRIYIYAAMQEGDPAGYRKLRCAPEDLPRGVLVGTVEIVNCTGRPGDYRWHLASPRRLRRPRRPKNHPQPAWFQPF